MRALTSQMMNACTVDTYLLSVLWLPPQVRLLRCQPRSLFRFRTILHGSENTPGVRTSVPCAVKRGILRWRGPQQEPGVGDKVRHFRDPNRTSDWSVEALRTPGSGIGALTIEIWARGGSLWA